MDETYRTPETEDPDFLPRWELMTKEDRELYVKTGTIRYTILEQRWKKKQEQIKKNKKNGEN